VAADDGTPRRRGESLVGLDGELVKIQASPIHGGPIYGMSKGRAAATEFYFYGWDGRLYFHVSASVDPDFKV
jgi:hypothetical protein